MKMTSAQSTKMEALNLTLVKRIRGAAEKIPKFSFGRFYPILDFISFFSPFIMIKNVLLFQAEFLNLKSYLISIGVLFIAAIFVFWFHDIAFNHPYLFLLPPVIINSLNGGIGPAFLSIFIGVVLSNFIQDHYQLSPALFNLDRYNIAFILEGLTISWISIIQKRRQQVIAVDLLREQSARLRAQSTSLNLRRLERQKDDFIAIAAHELRNPLASAKAFTQLAKSNAKSKNTKQYLNRLEIQIDRLDQMVNQLFDVSGMASGKMELKKSVVNFDELVLATVIELRHTITSHQIVIEGHTKAELSLDPTRIREVIVNLVNNAVKYSPHANQVIVQLKTNHNFVKVLVQDFGEGIAPEDQRRIFERFYRAHSHQTSGLGLGLYIVSEIIKLHQGRIWLTSQLGKGSTFSFSLPKPNNLTTNPEEKYNN